MTIGQKYTTQEFEEIQALVTQARKALAEVDECQKKLRSKGIDCGINGESKFVVRIIL